MKAPDAGLRLPSGKSLSVLGCLILSLIFLAPACTSTGGSPVYHAPSRTSPRSTMTALKDAALLARIEAKVFSDDLVSRGDADIIVRHGVVYLEGTTSDPYQARMLVDLIRTVDGVTRVENRMQTPRSGTTFVSANAFVSSKIKMSFLKDRELNSQPIVVETSDQEVVLTGRVTSQGQKQRAGAIALDHAGDRKVLNKITAP